MSSGKGPVSDKQALGSCFAVPGRRVVSEQQSASIQSFARTPQLTPMVQEMSEATRVRNVECRKEVR